MQHLMHREVEVITSETIYRGILIEVGESEVHLQSENGWIVIPMAKILNVKAMD